MTPKGLPIALTAALLTVASVASAQQQSTPRTTAPNQPQGRPAQPSKQAAPPAKSAQPAPAAQASAPPSDKPALLGQYGEWGAYAANPGGRKVCFALAKPASSQTKPANRPRDAVYAFVSSRPAEKVKDEVSVIIGYAFKPASEATAEIGSAKFAMYTQADGAWIKNAAEENRLVEAMRKGSDLVVKGVSGRGTESTDTFSLRGLAQALDRAAQECR
jgi:Invasion associated locus B (IalB) protein